MGFEDNKVANPTQEDLGAGIAEENRQKELELQEKGFETGEAQAERVDEKERNEAFVGNYRETVVKQAAVIDGYLEQSRQTPINVRNAVNADLRQSEEYRKFLGIAEGGSMTIDDALSARLAEITSYKENPEQMSQALDDLNNLRRVANDYALRLEEATRTVGANDILEKIKRRPEVIAVQAESNTPETQLPQPQPKKGGVFSRLRGLFGGK